ncbi:hypothetical protein FGO68_gene9334 [Halteria grandinella]|uniref:Uncharacterized protein n=1 Tax=Halteria grandinella TaxID=5974 RepID=A0A8J8NKR0_HALGN|nr:hypothetical protein FGO68_gene9334 [Halteria grandinella]
MGCTKSTVKEPEEKAPTEKSDSESDEIPHSRMKITPSDFDYDETGIKEIDKYIRLTKETYQRMLDLTDSLDKNREKLEIITGFDQHMVNQVKLRQLAYAILLRLFSAADGNLSKVKVETRKEKPFLRITLTNLSTDVNDFIGDSENCQLTDYIQVLEDYINEIKRVQEDMKREFLQKPSLFFHEIYSIKVHSSEEEQKDADSIVRILLKELNNKIALMNAIFSRRTIRHIIEQEHLFDALQVKDELELIAKDGMACNSLKIHPPPVNLYLHIYGTVTEIRRGIPKPKMDEKGVLPTVKLAP